MQSVIFFPADLTAEPSKKGKQGMCLTTPRPARRASAGRTSLAFPERTRAQSTNGVKPASYAPYG